jgi:hypothetical protein
MHAAHLPTKSHGVSQEAGVEVPYHLSGGETGHRPHTPCPDNIDLSIGFCLLFPALERLTRFHDEIVVGRGDVQHIVPEQGERHRSAAVDAHGVRFELERFPGDKVTVQPLTMRAARDPRRLVAPLLAAPRFTAPLSVLLPRAAACLPVPFLEAPRSSVRARLTDLVARAMTCSSRLVPTL